MTGNRPYIGALQRFDNSSYSNECDATYMRGANFVDGPNEAVQTSFVKRLDTSGPYFSQPALCQHQSVETARDFSNFYQFHMGISEAPRGTALYDCHRVDYIERFNNSGGINVLPTKGYSSQSAPFYGSNINIADMGVMQPPYHFPYHGFEGGLADLSRNNHFSNVNKEEVNNFMEYDCGKLSKDNCEKINKEHQGPVLSQRMKERFSRRDDTFMEQKNLTEESDVAFPFSPTCKDSSSFQRPTGTISKAPLWKKWSALKHDFKLNATEVHVKKEVLWDPIEGDDLCRANERTVQTYSNFITPFDDYDTRRFHGNVNQEDSGFSASSAHSYTTCKTPTDMDAREMYKCEMSMDGERSFRPKTNDIWSETVDDSYDNKQNDTINRHLREDVYDAYSPTGNKEKMRSPSNKIAIPFLPTGRAIYKKAELIVEEIKKTMNLSNAKFAVITEGHQRNNSKHKIGQDCLQNNGNSNKDTKIQNGLSTGTPQRFLKITNGYIVLSLPLAPLENPKDNNESVYVNRKQCDRILKRRIARAKLELSGRVQRWRGTKKYLHESRHLHAVKRSRGKGGRFVKHAQEIKLESLTESDIKNDSPLDEILQGLC